MKSKMEAGREAERFLRQRTAKKRGSVVAMGIRRCYINNETGKFDILENEETL